MRTDVRVFASLLWALSAIGGWALAPPVARADDVGPPVPAELQPPGNTEAFLVGHAFGTQNYVCLPAGGGFAWTLFTPEATLFANEEKQLTTHFFAPNPDEGGTVRAAWQHSRDTSTVWARLFRDPVFVDPDAIPWLLLEVVGRREGPGGGDALTSATFVQRIHTVGGAAPRTGCAVAADVGAKAFMPYEADYVFLTGSGD